MKQLFTLIFILFFSTIFFGATINHYEDHSKAANVVAKYLSTITFDEEISSDASINIILSVTSDNEIVVLTVNTHSNDIRRAIKNALNQKKMYDGNLISGKEYSFVLNVKGS
ncbi:hypothetical protein [Flavobacterium sp.]|uniref:hypothetical protein n=1 Tax=Flavobacterium sp. TaxID=239 RepID=UPI00286E53EF|nr:hypothetical protein [Flavobacterium sp.]